MDYYFQDQLRWTWGFDNPNKTAALLVSILPLLWISYALAWNISEKTWRWAGLFGSGVCLLLGWFLLLMTYSRGGLVGAVLAFGYIVWQLRRAVRWRSVRMRVAVGLLALVGGYGGLNGVAHRSMQWIGTHEGSVENRFELWKGSLAMIASIPRGVGTGQSGHFYVQWFQSLESTSRYRTLVNSYLTFAAEKGVAVFAVGLFGAVLFWRITRRVSARESNGTLGVGLRASLIGFAAAGFFSTTMEEWKLWMIPMAVSFLLIGRTCLSKQPPGWKGVLREASLVTLGALIPLSIYATWLRQKAALGVSLVDGKSTTVLVTPKSGTKRTLQVAVDSSVLGGDAGRLLRRLALANGLQLVVESGQEWLPGYDCVLTTGSQVVNLTHPAEHDWILVAPTMLDDAVAENLLQKARTVHLMLPDFDEDGRVAFWKEKVAAGGRKEVTVATLPGVGTQIEWAWESVITELAH